MTILGLFYFLLFLLECNSQNGQLEIVGGDPIKVEDAPFFAIYRRKDMVHGCGASIVTEQFVISAAHCSYYSIAPKEVVVATDNIHAGEHHDIKGTYIHPKYARRVKDYDIVVLKLEKKLVFSEKIQPIKLAEPGMVIEDDAVFQTMGFGVTDPANPDKMSDILLAVDVPYVNNEKCNKAYGKRITKRMICAGEEGKDSCQDDSGGPLVYEDTLIGIVSFGKGCAKKYWPGVYARVSALREFIDEVIQKNS